MESHQNILTLLALLFSAGTMFGTILYARATKQLADATASQANISLELARIAQETSRREAEESKQRRNQRYIFLAQRLHELWVQSSYMDNEVRKHNNTPINLSVIPEVAELRLMFIRFMDEHGSEVASYVGVNSIGWEGLRYFEDMVRWVAAIPPKFLGQEDFYARYKSVNQHLLLVRGSLIEKTKS